MNRKMAGLFDRIGFKRGYRAEDRLEQILREKGWKYRRSPRGSPKDRRGIDFELWAEGQKLLLDVKSSHRGVRERVEKNTGKKTYVFPLLIRPGESKRVIERRLLFLIAKHKEFVRDIKNSQRRCLDEKWGDWKLFLP